jgi:hypothetical protein
MYTAFFTIGFGFFLTSANWTVGTLYLVPFTVMYVTRVSAEERMMLDRFGDSSCRGLDASGREYYADQCAQETARAPIQEFRT